MLGLQHLDVPHSRGRTDGTAGEEDKRKAENSAKSTEEVDTSEKAGTGGIVKHKANQK